MYHYSLSLPPIRREEGSICMFSTLDTNSISGSGTAGGGASGIFCQAIDSCEKELVARVFVLDEQKILESLKKKILQGVKSCLEFHKIYPEETSEDIKQLPQANSDFVVGEHDRLVGGIKYHKKTLLIDGYRILLGTGNFSKASLEKDVNIFIDVNSSRLYELIANENEGSCRVGEETVTYYPLRKNKRLAKQNILKIIQQAKSTIKIAMYIFSYEKIFFALKDAKKRGVDVQIIVDKNNQPKKEFPSQLNVLEWTGKGALHCKICLIDENQLFLGSPNWTACGFDLNFEDLVLIQNLSAANLDFIKKFFETIIKSTQPVQSPSQSCIRSSSSSPTLPSPPPSNLTFEESCLGAVGGVASPATAVESGLNPNAAEFVPSWMK